METTDLFGQIGQIETGKGGKPRLVFGETPPPTRHEPIYRRSDQTPAASPPAPTPATPAAPTSAARPTPAGEGAAARPPADKRRPTSPPPSPATPSPGQRYQRACLQAALLTTMLQVAADEVEQLKRV